MAQEHINTLVNEVIEENINSQLYKINESAKAAISIDCVIFGYDGLDLKVLTLTCNMKPYLGYRSLIGDLINSNEGLNESASRILYERVGLKDLYLKQVRAFGMPKRHPLGRVISIAYFTVIALDYQQSITKKMRNPMWVNLKDINELAFDHNDILNVCLNSLKEEIKSFPIVFNILPKKFTLIELQQVYETILNIELDNRNFRRKIRKIPYIKALEEMQTGVNHRPARLYYFDFDAYDRDQAKQINNFELH